MKKIHFVGIGGIGMSALAHILLDRKISVSGSDLALSPKVADLTALGASIRLGHASEAIQQEMDVVYNSMVKESNVELQAARRLGIRLLHRSELLCELMEGYKPLAVTGTHGKTTTASLLAYVLDQVGLDPAFAVGGTVPSLQRNGRHGGGEYFVLEADESDGTFLRYHPFGAILTNIEPDHLDHFGTFEKLKSVFATFAGQVGSADHLFVCADDSSLAGLNVKGVGYGFSAKAPLRASRFVQEGCLSSFDIDFDGRHYPAVRVPLIGQYNALNALAVFGLCMRLGVGEEAIRAALLSFPGVLRRQEIKGEEGSVLVVDDYAHHPTEIEVTLKALKKAYSPRRLVVLFQPHRYTRLESLLKEFVAPLLVSDELIILDIYGAGELPIPGVDSDLLAGEVRGASSRNVVRLKGEPILDEIIALLKPRDVVVTLGAGDITDLGQALLERLKVRPPERLRVGLVRGGESSEHAVSLRSAAFFESALDPALYDVERFTISPKGVWESLSFQGMSERVSPDIVRQLLAGDLFIPVLHGPNGEDGLFAALFEAIGKPYVACDFRSASACMDKVATKCIARAHGIRTAPFLPFWRDEWERSPERAIERICAALKFPVYVKPAHLGSTIGVSRVETPSGLEEAAACAFSFDNRLLVEQGLVGRELEFAVLGNESPQVAGPGEILSGGTLYSYEMKYGENCFGVDMRPSLPPDVKAEGRRLALEAYRALGCGVLARVDFFLDHEGRYWLNEINPFPGFTPSSLYPKAWEEEGLNPVALIDLLISYALERTRALATR